MQRNLEWNPYNCFQFAYSESKLQRFEISQNDNSRVIKSTNVREISQITCMQWFPSQEKELSKSSLCFISFINI